MLLPHLLFISAYGDFQGPSDIVAFVDLRNLGFGKLLLMSDALKLFHIFGQFLLDFRP
jgi:hypothetical protein